MNSKTNLLSLVRQSITDKEMSVILGGERKKCECACSFENQGGTPTADNTAANFAENISSPVGCNRIIKTENRWEVIVQNHE